MAQRHLRLEGSGGGRGPPTYLQIPPPVASTSSPASHRIPTPARMAVQPQQLAVDVGSDQDGPQGSGVKASEFVKKLYKMLEDTDNHSIVGWGHNGDSFLVKDMNEFTKTILPKHFKHSNFASFVRQLNKYDFHKVKNPESGEGIYGDHTWEFRHPNFRADNKQILENIKRKAPAPRKPTTVVTPVASPNVHGSRPPVGASRMPSTIPGGSSSRAMAAEDPQQLLTSMRAQISSLHHVQHNMSQHIMALTKDYQAVVGEVVNFQRTFVAQDQLLHYLIQYLINQEHANGERRGDNQMDADGQFVPSAEAQRLMSSYSAVTRTSLEEVNELARRAAAYSYYGGTDGNYEGGPAPPMTTLPPTGYPVGYDDRGASSNATVVETRSSPSSAPDTPAGPFENGSPSSTAHGGSGFSEARPRVRSANYQASPSTPNYAAQYGPDPQLPASAPATSTAYKPDPRKNGSTPFPRAHPSSGPVENGDDTFYARGADVAPQYGIPAAPEPSTQPTTVPPVEAASVSSATAHVDTDGTRRPGYLPAWTVPPKVLLVEDDAVCRRLSSKFLQVFGCTIDVAVDGVSAVNKMNLEKYDLVFMDIMMPHLDGVSATSLIRQFDAMTPIISMTSNSNPSEIITYFSHGMNDILPKPFTKEGLLGMLEKHLIHLKQMQQLSEIPRALGYAERDIQHALLSTLAPPSFSTEATYVPGQGNPFADMGVTDADFNSILHGLVSNDAHHNAHIKRSLSDEVVVTEEEARKRTRFQELEP